MGGLLIAPDTSITVSTRGNRREHSGIWYNLEGYYKYYLNASYYQNLYGIQVSLDQSQLDTVNQALANADHWPTIPYDYIVYYGTSLTPSQEFS